MSDNSPVRIELAAANALVEWKHLFAGKVREHAKQLAAESGQPNLITLTHYQQAAAKIALCQLAESIGCTEITHAPQCTARS